MSSSPKKRTRTLLNHLQNDQQQARTKVSKKETLGIGSSGLATRDAGSSGLVMSVLGFGCWQFGSKGKDDYWGLEYTQEMANKMVQIASSKGVTYFDTAADYAGGDSEIQLGAALKTIDPQIRNKIVIGSKITPNNCVDVEKHLNETLERLQIETIDLFMVHWPIDSNSMSHFAAHNTTESGGRDYAATGKVEAVPPTTLAFQTLLKLQKTGKIKHIGVSNFGVSQLKEVLALGVNIAVNQLCYNLIFRAIEFEILPFCQAHGIGVVCYSPLMQSLLTGRWKNADDVPTYRARTRHFNGKRPKSRHGEGGHEALLFNTLSKIEDISKRSGISMLQLALAWPLSNSAVVSVIAGITKERYISSNCEAIATKIPDNVLAELNLATEALKNAMGGNADLWQGGDDSRIK